jgi:hypothetical protein
MEIREAMERLDTIHEHLVRSEEYRGFKAAGVAVTGFVGLVAAAVQPLFGGGAEFFVVYWVAIAVISAVVSVSPALHAYWRLEDEFTRRRTRRVLWQFLPCVLAGAAITAFVSRAHPDVVPCLPGIWALVFGLGLVAERPYLPAAIGGVAFFYLAAGAILLAVSATAIEPSGWAVGGVFGPGQLASAVILARGGQETRDE